MGSLLVRYRICHFLTEFTEKSSKPGGIFKNSSQKPGLSSKRNSGPDPVIEIRTGIRKQFLRGLGNAQRMCNIDP